MSPTPLAIRAVLLDLDGTLADTAGEIGVALNEMLAELGAQPMSLAAVTALIGRGVRSLVERALDDAYAVADLDHAVERFETHYARLIATQATLFPGVEEGLEALRAAGMKLGVVTNKPRAFTMKLLQHLAIDGFFGAVVTGDDGIARKPRGDMLLHAARTLGADIPQTLMIGDSDNDVLAARAAGCLVWCVPYGYNEGRPAASLECDRMVASIADAARILAAR
jgi:phosphoglycolate phosphatase